MSQLLVISCKPTGSRELAELQPAQMPHVDNRHPGFTYREAAGLVAEIDMVAKGHGLPRRTLDRDAGAAQIEAVVDAAQSAVGAIVRAVDLEASANRCARPRFAEVQQWDIARRALQPGLAQCI